MGKFWQPGRDDAAAEQWLGGRRWTALAAFAFLVLVGVSAVVVFTAGRGSADRGGGSGGGAASAFPPAGVVPVPPAGAAAPVGAPADSGWDGGSAPPAVTWVLVHGVAVPSSPTAGPARVDGAISSGFAHNRVGALLAAAQIGVRYLLADDAHWKAAALAMLAPGPGRDAWMRARGSLPPQSASDPPGTFRQLAGFRLVSYTPAQAVIQLVSRSPRDGSLQVVATQVVWRDGDWKLQLAPGGGIAGSAEQIPSLAGFVAWAGL